MGGGLGFGLVLPLLLFSVIRAPAAAAMVAEPRTEKRESGGGGQLSSRMMVPGFMYTRSRGRCTPQFWSSRREAWPKMIPQGSSISKVFGSGALERFEPGLTLFEATERNDDIGGNPFSQLVKQSSAALLNSYTRQGFPYSAWEVKTLFLQALVSEAAAADQAKRFAQASEECG